MKTRTNLESAVEKLDKVYNARKEFTAEFTQGAIKNCEHAKEAIDKGITSLDAQYSQENTPSGVFAFVGSFFGKKEVAVQPEQAQTKEQSEKLQDAQFDSKSSLLGKAENAREQQETGQNSPVLGKLAKNDKTVSEKSNERS